MTVSLSQLLAAHKTGGATLAALIAAANKRGATAPVRKPAAPIRRSEGAWTRLATVKVWLALHHTCGHTTTVPANEHLFIRWRRGGLMWEQAAPAGLINPATPVEHKTLHRAADGECHACSLRRIESEAMEATLDLPFPRQSRGADVPAEAPAAPVLHPHVPSFGEDCAARLAAANRLIIGRERAVPVITRFWQSIALASSEAGLADIPSLSPTGALQAYARRYPNGFINHITRGEE